jgi:hypothetical protein
MPERSAVALHRFSGHLDEERVAWIGPAGQRGAEIDRRHLRQLDHGLVEPRAPHVVDALPDRLDLVSILRIGFGREKFSDKILASRIKNKVEPPTPETKICLSILSKIVGFDGTKKP